MRVLDSAGAANALSKLHMRFYIFMIESAGGKRMRKTCLSNATKKPTPAEGSRVFKPKPLTALHMQMPMIRHVRTPTRWAFRMSLTCKHRHRNVILSKVANHLPPGCHCLVLVTVWADTYTNNHFDCCFGMEIILCGSDVGQCSNAKNVPNPLTIVDDVQLWWMDPLTVGYFYEYTHNAMGRRAT